jgi:hypothetical protein
MATRILNDVWESDEQAFGKSHHPYYMDNHIMREITGGYLHVELDTNDNEDELVGEDEYQPMSETELVSLWHVDIHDWMQE